MTAAEVITAIRRLLNDEQTGQYQWSDTVLLRYLSDAQRALFRERPEVFLASGGMNTPVELSATSDTMKVDENHRDVLAWHVCATALGEDAEDRGSLEKSAQFMDRFVKGTSGVR